MTRLLRYVLLVVLALPPALYLLIWFPKAPIGSLEYGDGARGNTTLVVLLPGIYDSAKDFERHGFVSAARDRLKVDVVAVDAHIGYYLAGSVTERLHVDIVLPALRRGYRDIWLVGVSLGGLGSLLYVKAYPENVKGVYLISPFLMNPNARIDPAEWLEKQNGEQGLWEWLTAGSMANVGRPAIFLGYGEQDKFAGPNRCLADLLPAENVIRLPGGHDWRTWKLLWDRALERDPFAPPSGDRAN